jgi:oligosaccharide repeat unit polymerase
VFLFVLVVLTIGSAYYGRWLFGRWFNPLTCYAAGWGASLIACELRLIRYFWISDVAWFYMAVAYVAVFGGATLGVFATRYTPPSGQVVDETDHLRHWILLFTGLAAVAIVVEFRQTLHAYGSLLEMYANANDIYGRRMAGEFAGLSYFSYFVFPASALAGAYTARKRRVTAVALAPMLDLVLMSAISMGRMGPVFGGLLFAIAYAYSPQRGEFILSKRLIAGGAIVALLVIGTFAAISSFRGLPEVLPKQSRSLTRASEYVTTLPVNYLYLSAPAPALSYYLLHPEEDRRLVAGFTLAPLNRLLAKLGFATNVPQYTPFYHVPVAMNQATYLAYIHSDFGPLGIFIVPLTFGAVVGAMGPNLRNSGRLLSLMIFTHLFVAIIWSFSGYIAMFAHWFLSMVVSSAIGYYIDRAYCTPAPA